MARQRDPRPEPKKPERNPAFVHNEGEAMLQLARTIKALVESPAYTSAANPSWWKRTFG